MSQNNLDYTNYDFDDLVNQLNERLRADAAWRDIYQSSTGTMLIQFLAYVLNMALFYVERRAEESFLPTAQNRSSLVNLVSLLNYIPKRKTSAIGNLQFSIPTISDEIVYIPKYTECQSADGYKYLTNESVAIQKGQLNVTASGIQGELVQTEITSNGTLNQEYNLSSINVENSGDLLNPSLRVIIDGTEWSLVSSFLDSENTSNHYRIINEIDGTVSVLFGDNINGKSPASGSVIRIQYINSDGISGNVTFTGKITTINDTIYDGQGAVVSDISVTNSSAFLGGDAEESIEEIRNEAPQVFKTGDRAVTKADFISIIKNQSGVADANVWGENEEALAAGTTVDYEMLNKVKMSIILQEWQLPDSTFKTNLSNVIYNKSMLTVKYEFIEPSIINVIPTMSVVVTSGYSQSQAQADIEEELANLFLLGDTAKLGTKIKYSQIVSALHDLAGVSYLNLTLEIYKVLSSTYDSNYNWGATLDLTDVKPETTRLFINGNYVTTDVDNGDGTGTFSSAGVYTINGTINYTTGVVVLDISPSATSVYVRYQQDSLNNLVPTFNEICKLYDTDITDIEMES